MPWRWRRRSIGVIDFMRWPALLVMMSAVIALLLPLCTLPSLGQMAMLSVGTLVATLLWLLGLAGLSLYVRYFANFSELYGSWGRGRLDAVVSALRFVVFLGAEINYELERQTRQDTPSARTAAGLPQRLCRRYAGANASLESEDDTVTAEKDRSRRE